MIKWVAIITTTIIVLAVAIGLIAGSVRDLDPNEVAFDYDGNVGLLVDDTTLYQGGRYFLGLNHDFIVFPKTVQALVIPTQQMRTADGLAVQIDITVQYVFSPLTSDALKNIYYTFQEDYETAFTYMIEGLTRDVAADYYASDFYELRAEIQTAMLMSLRSFFAANLSVSIEDLQLVSVTLTDALTQEIQNTELAKQDSLSAINERVVAELDLSTNVGQSYGDIAILYQSRDNQVNITLTSAYSQADTIKSIYVDEATALSAILNSVNLTVDEFQAYMWLNALSGTSATVHLSIGTDQQLLP